MAGPSLCSGLGSGLRPSDGHQGLALHLGSNCWGSDGGMCPQKEGESPPGPNLVLGMTDPGALCPLPRWPHSFHSGVGWLALSHGTVGSQHLSSRAGLQGPGQWLDLLLAWPGPQTWSSWLPPPQWGGDSDSPPGGEDFLVAGGREDLFRPRLSGSQIT